jgi:FkbM family methyltransferase
MNAARLLKRLRENYYFGNALAVIAWPLHVVCKRLSIEIQRKVKRNGVAIRLPNSQTLRLARDAGIAISSLLFWNGLDGYEPQTSKTLRFFFERSATFVDVGANYGYYSILGGLWNSTLRVVSFEPVPEIYEALNRNIALNRLQQRVATFNLALSDRSGKATFFLPPGESKDCEATGTLVPDGWQSRKQSPSFEVETARFDDFERLYPMKVDVVKIDVEDFEYGVLGGMQGVISRDRPFIICEILPRGHRNQKTKAVVESLGYTPYWITPSGPCVRVSHFDFRRDSSMDFLLSPVTVPGEEIADLDVLWTQRHASRRAIGSTTVST